MQAIVSAQHAYFNTNTTKPVEFRIRQLLALKDVLRSNETALQDAIHLDYGKGVFETFLTEFFLIYHEIDVAIGNLDRWARAQPVAINTLNAPATAHIIAEPRDTPSPVVPCA